MGGGGTRGGFESNLKGLQNSTAGLWGPRQRFFLLRYFGFEMELKTYFSLASQEWGLSPKSQVSSFILQGLGCREGALKLHDSVNAEFPRYAGSCRKGCTGVWQGRRTAKSISWV